MIVLGVIANINGQGNGGLPGSREQCVDLSGRQPATMCSESQIALEETGQSGKSGEPHSSM